MSLQYIYDWILSQRELLWWLGMASLGVLVLSCVLLPLAVLHLPGDYLARAGSRESRRFSELSLRERWVMVLRNLLGGLLVLAGIAMLLTPGQGLVSIAVGVGLMNFPRKKEILRRVAAQRRVLRTINRFRRRFGRPPLRAPH